MSWKFDQFKAELIWVISTTELVESGVVDLGGFDSDLSVDAGDRTNDSSILDQGLRVVDGNI